MHISQLSLVNYRNFKNARLIFKKGINTVIGENGTGKTNLFRAIRLLLDDDLIRSAYRMEEKDFFRGIGRWQGHWIIISLEFEEISQDEAIQSLFLHGTGNIPGSGPIGKATYNLIFRPNIATRVKLSQLRAGDVAALEALQTSITLDHYETIFTGKSEADFNSETFYTQTVGDFTRVIFSRETEFPAIGIKLPKVLSIYKEISFTFIQALRDVVGDFHNNRTNPLLTLLNTKSGEIDPAHFEPISALVRDLNDKIEDLPEVETLRGDITQTIKAAAGETYSPTSLSIKSDLPDDADKLFKSLKLFVGESDEDYEGAIHELSLGGANLIYLTLKLLEFKYQRARQSFANFLLIEEPEAHIHTHIQKTLFDRLGDDAAQIIYSTHSTHISEVSNVSNMNILGKHGTLSEAYQPSTNLNPPQIDSIQRYLDAVRSNLLFAKSVILVEGDAEEILIPILVKKVLGISLDEMGISLINIRSTGFENVAVLFHATRIKKRCCIVTDLDTSIINTTPAAADAPALKEFKRKCKASETKGLARKTKMDLFCAGNPWLSLCLAPNTFEVDFITAGNAESIVNIIGDIYVDPATVAEAQTDLRSPNIALYGKRVLTMAENKGKGWFAILVGKTIGYDTKIPDYILDAIFFAYPLVSDETWINILSYRLRCMRRTGACTPELHAAFKTTLSGFQDGTVTFPDIKAAMRASFPDDDINHILDRF